jgi:hypothetical protein
MNVRIVKYYNVKNFLPRRKIKQGVFMAILCWFTCLSHLNAQNNDSRYASHSALAQGKWIQLKVTENAVYKLTYDDIKKMGINDPAKIKIYGYGGWILDHNFTKSYVDDLPEVTVWMNKGSDNQFNSGDYLLFYGRGTVKWTYSSDVFIHENNSYSTYGSYFITESEQGPKEMPRQDSYSNTSSAVTTFDDFALHERDSISILYSGRELFGESFVGKTSQNFSFNIPGITNDAGNVSLSFAAAPKSTTPVTLSIGNEELINLNIGTISGDYRKANLVEGTRKWEGNKTENVTVNVSYNSAGQSVAYLNFIRLNVKRKLQFYNTAYTFFRNKNSSNTALKYTIDNASANCLVWNITDNQDVKIVQTSLEGNQLNFGADVVKNTVSEYVMVDVSKTFPTPQVVGEIKNQDLHGLPPTEMVIIVPEAFASFAEKLAEKHRELQGLHVTVVQPEKIYNEFSSGAPDATAYRRFMKMFYDRAANEEEKPKYLLLYGDGFFDNRFISTSSTNINPKYYLLTYQFAESVDEDGSYGTDDYFGFLDDAEGLNLGSDKLDIGIGRFPVSSSKQAEVALNKVVGYMDKKNYGQWKNTVIFTADDVDADSKTFSDSHASQADRLAVYMETNHPEYNVAKSFMDAFQPIDLNGKRTYPDAKKKLLNTMKEGCFLFNYTGHGSKTALSGEDMMNVSDVRNMNFEKLPLWITATCDFGWFDGIVTSAGEEVFLNKNSAGIALFTTSRVVYSTNNYVINDKLIRNIFSKKDGKRPTLGDIIRQSKIDVGSDRNKLNFVLLGDPALTLNYPDWEIVLENINGKPVQENDTVRLRALDKMTLEGFIVDENGLPANDFTGNIYATVFDGKQTTKSVTYKTNENGERVYWSFNDYPNIVYKGNHKLENGRFSVSFTVPLDISYTNNIGKMNFYASDETKQKDAAGSFQNFILSGTSDNPVLSESGPEIKAMYLNSESFSSGDNVNETPFFLAKVFDEEGINMAGSGLGHDITICIDNNPEWTYNLNSYYQPEDGMNGLIGFSIPSLPEGKHDLIFRIWNILNNSNSDSLKFNVVKGLKPEIYAVTARPNPAKESAWFHLEHNRPESPMEIEIRVYDLTGRSIWSHVETGSSGYLRTYPVEWNLTNNGGQRVSQGIYIYQASIKTQEGKEATKSKKLVVTGQ